MKYWFLAGLHKVHPAYRMVNAGWAGVFNRVPTYCNQLLPHLLADIFQTLHSCDGHIEFLKVFGHFSKNLHTVEFSHFSSMFWVNCIYRHQLTLCNQLLPHLYADILQTLYSCYGHIEDVLVTFWKITDTIWNIYM
jgi:hypothetical protein